MVKIAGILLAVIGGLFLAVMVFEFIDSIPISRFPEAGSWFTILGIFLFSGGIALMLLPLRTLEDDPAIHKPNQQPFYLPEKH